MAQQFSDKVIVLNNGTIFANGKSDEVLNSKELNDVYGIDVRGFMRESLEKWK
jgi:iron complex transport system ATP-binding protein